MLGTDNKFIIYDLLETKEETERRNGILDSLDKAVELNGLVKIDDVLESIYKDYAEEQTKKAKKKLQELQVELVERNKAFTKAKNAKRLFVGTAIFAVVVTLPLIVGVAAIAAVVGVAVAIPGAAIYAFMQTIPDTKTRADRLLDRVKSLFLGMILSKIKQAIWDDKLKKGYDILNKDLSDASGKVKETEEKIKPIQKTIGETTDRVDSEKKALKQIVEDISKLEESAYKKTSCTLTLSTMGDIGVEILCRSLERLSKRSPGPVWPSLTLNLANCGLTEQGRDRLAAAISSPGSDNLKIQEIDLTGTKLKEFFDDKFCLALETNVTITAVKYDPAGVSDGNKTAITRQLVINRYLQGSSDEDLLKYLASESGTVEKIFDGNTPEEKLASIKAAAEKKIKQRIQQGLRNRYDCLAGKPGTLKSENFEALKKELDENYDLTSFDFTSYGLGLAPNEKVQDYVNFICKRNLIKKLENKSSLTDEEVTKLVADFEGIKPEYYDRARSLLDAILSKLKEQQLQKVESCLNQGMQKYLKHRFECLQGNIGPLNGQSFADLQKELDDNYDLVKLELTGSINEGVRKYINFICERNQLYKFYIDLEKLRVDKGAFINFYVENKNISPDNYYKILEQIGKKNPSFLAVIKQYMEGDSGILVAKLQELLTKNPKAFEAMLKYQLGASNPQDPELEGKVKLITNLLGSAGLFDGDKKQFLSVLVHGVINKEMWQNKTLLELREILAKEGIKVGFEKERVADHSSILQKLGIAGEQKVEPMQLQLQITESSTNEDRQKYLMTRFECLAGNAGFVDKQSFKDLKSELDGNYTLTKYDFSTKNYRLTLAPSTDVQSYVNFICERNKVYECAKDKGSVGAFINAFAEVNPSNYDKVLKQIGEKDPAILNVIQKCLGSGIGIKKADIKAGKEAELHPVDLDADSKTTAANLQKLAQEKPEALEAMLRYNFNNPPPPVENAEYKVRLVSGLLKIKELKSFEIPVFSFIRNITSGAWKGNAPKDLEENISVMIPDINLAKKPGMLDSGIKTDIAKIVYEAREKIDTSLRKIGRASRQN